MQLLQLVHGRHDPAIRDRVHSRRAGGTGGGRVRERRGRGRPGRRLPLPPHGRAPAPAGRGGTDPRPPDRSRRPRPPGAGARLRGRARHHGDGAFDEHLRRCQSRGPDHPRAPLLPAPPRSLRRPGPVGRGDGAEAAPATVMSADAVAPPARPPSVSPTPAAPAPRSRSWPVGSPRARGSWHSCSPSSSTGCRSPPIPTSAFSVCATSSVRSHHRAARGLHLPRITRGGPAAVPAPRLEPGRWPRPSSTTPS